MSSKTTIFSRIKNIDLPSKEMPVLPIFNGLSDDKVAFFIEMLEILGVTVIQGNNLSDINTIIEETGYAPKDVFSNIHALTDKTDANPSSPKDLKLSVLEGSVGVAENGAIWIDSSVLPNRALTAIGENLLIALPLSKIVWNMHEAYTYIRPQDTGYGVFISGPSETKDIGQSLAKGTHGTRTLRVFLY